MSITREWDHEEEMNLKLTFLTFDFRVSRIPRRTIAQRLVVDDCTFGVDSALARVHAQGVVAGLVQGAFLVSLATHFDRFSC